MYHFILHNDLLSMEISYQIKIVASGFFRCSKQPSYLTLARFLTCYIIRHLIHLPNHIILAHHKVSLIATCTFIIPKIRNYHPIHD